MRILFLNPTAQLGGAEVALLDILASLRKAEPSWELHLIASDEGALVERARGLGVFTNVLPFPPSISRLGDASAGGPAGNETGQFELLSRVLRSTPGIVGYAWRLRRLLRRLAPDVIHTNGFKMHLLGALAKPRRVPLIWHVHDYVRARPLMARSMKLFSRCCSVALTNSHSVASDVRAACGDTLRVQTIYNGVDTTVFSPRGAGVDLDSLSGLAPVNGSTVRVGMLATLARWKGHETFLRALSLLPRDLSLRAYIIGGALYQTDGSQHSLAELKAMAREMGLTDRIGFTGFVDEPAAAMRSVDIVVHASTEPEPFGLVIAEGMACGRAVIASDAGGAAELFDVNVNALSHPPGDVIALAQRIEELVTKPELRARLGAAGRATAEQRFDRSRLASELVPIYSEVRSQRSEVRGQKSEVRGQKSEVRGQTSEVRGQRSDLVGETNVDLQVRARQSGGISNEFIYKKVAEELERRNARGVLVDVGCGAGGFFSFVSNHFEKYIGVDAVKYEEFPADARFAPVDLDSETVPLPDEIADVVVAIEIIEHLENPRAFMRELRRLTKRGGLVVVTTPNQLSLLSLLTLIVKKRFSAFQDVHYPAHLTALLEVDLVRIATECGFIHISLAYTCNGRLVLTPRHYPRFIARLVPRALSDNVLLICTRPSP